LIDATVIAPLIDFVIAFTVVEGVALALYHRATGKGVAPREFALNLASGLCLMLALRGAVQDAGAAWIALALLGAGLAHGSDLLLRWRRGARSAAATRQVIA
jgi:hypothetical protein